MKEKRMETLKKERENKIERKRKRAKLREKEIECD